MSVSKGPFLEFEEYVGRIGSIFRVPGNVGILPEFLRACQSDMV